MFSRTAPAAQAPRVRCRVCRRPLVGEAARKGIGPTCEAKAARQVAPVAPGSIVELRPRPHFCADGLVWKSIRCCESPAAARAAMCGCGGYPVSRERVPCECAEGQAIAERLAAEELAEAGAPEAFDAFDDVAGW